MSAHAALGRNSAAVAAIVLAMPPANKRFFKSSFLSFMMTFQS
jgi:hypothetical protein